MNTNNQYANKMEASKTNEQNTVNEKIENFFRKEVDHEYFAKQLRRANYILSNVMMQPQAEYKITGSHWVSDCHYFLNEFAELIDPVLEKE